ncbi:MAG: ChaN family lipoprotein [Deltaproteobacteria bacterium]|nr:ChaN family lipoprotein [Deltaproteobacteria bacterium]
MGYRRLQRGCLGLALSLMALAVGCAGMNSTPPRVLAPGDYLAPPDPHPLSRDELEGRLAKARVVLVGERHDHPGHHAIQLQVLKALAAQGPLVVGVEWLQQDAQPACDALSAGKITLEEFRAQVKWEQNWGFPWKMVAPIFAEVRSQSLTLVALNAPQSVVRQVARGGLKSLTTQQRASIAPALNLDDPVYRKKVARQFAFHGVKDPEAQENFFAAQVVRDETMAHNLALRLVPWPDGGKRGLVLAGAGHVAGDMGLPPRITRRLPGARPLTILPVSAKGALMMNMAGENAPADLLAVSTPAPPPPPRLGLLLGVEKGGLVVKRLIPGSPAQKAGVLPGDLLLAVDSKPLKSPKGIHDAIKAAPFAPHTYLVERNGHRLSIDITLPRPGAAAAPK